MNILKQITAASLTALLMLSLASCTAENEAAQVPVTSDVEEGGEIAVYPLRLAKGSVMQTQVDPDTYSFIAQTQVPAVILEPGCYDADAPAATALNLLNREKKESGEAWFRDALDYAAGDDAVWKNEDYYYSLHQTASVRRGDTEVISILYHSDEFMGGAHPFQHYESATVDCATGSLLSLEDVVADPAAFLTQIGQAFNEKYADNGLSDAAEILPEAYANGETDTFVWVMDYAGITVFTNPCTLGCYAQGSQCATIPYCDIDLAREEYAIIPETYSIDLDGFTETVYPDENGDLHTIRILPTAVEYDLTSGADFYLDTAEEPVFTDDSFLSYTLDACLIVSPAGRSLCMQSTEDDMYCQMHTYRLEGSSVIAADTVQGGLSSYSSWDQDLDLDPMYEGYCFTALLTDPSDFTLRSICQLLGTSSINRTYLLGPDAVPVARDDSYSITEKHEMQLLQALTAATVDAETCELGDLTALDAGTFILPFRTDGSSWVDVYCYSRSIVEPSAQSDAIRYGSIPDDAVSVRVEVDSSQWPYTINWTDVDLLLDGVFWAG